VSHLAAPRRVKPALVRCLSVTAALLLAAGALSVSVTQVAASSPSAAASAGAASTAPHGFLDDSTTGAGTSTSTGGVQPSATGTPTVAAGFSSSVIFSGLDHPTAVRFASDGSVWVILKTGQILAYSSLSATTPTVFADIVMFVTGYFVP
jgi:glucose/arabinose dehydrogenase